MKADLKDALNTWPSDTKSSVTSVTMASKDYVHYIKNKSATMHDYIKTLEKIDENTEDLFDRAYSDSHFITGFGEIIKSPKVVHLGTLSELITDFARNIQDYSKYSMTYLLELIHTKICQICVDLIDDKKTEMDINDVVLECSIYLLEPVTDFSQKNKIVQSEVSATYSDIMPVVETTKTRNPDECIAEEPEELDIPPEKIGLISDFCEEAWENLQTSENLLIDLENDPHSMESVNALFRSVHTIKGGSRLIEIKKIEALSHELETVLDQVRSQTRNLTTGLIDISLACIKRIYEIVDEVSVRGPINTNVNDLIEILRSGSDKLKPNSKTEIDIKDKPSEHLSKVGETQNENGFEKVPSNVQREEAIKVSADKLDSVLNSSSEVYTTRIKLENNERLLAEGITKLNETVNSFRRKLDAGEFSHDANINLVAHNVENTVALFDENTNLQSVQLKRNLNSLDNYQNELSIGVERISLLQKLIQKNIEELEVLSSRLQSGAMNFRMVPVANLFNRFPAQVREIARQIDKKIELNISGGETELDKILINQLSDPLLHIIRNSIDHGIESNEVRSLLNKPELGQISLKAYYQGSNAIVEVEDDGKGINPDIIFEKALEKGLLRGAKRNDFSEKEIFDFIFEPGFSSVETVTELSGRGVGMDVVKTAVNRIQGSIKVQSQVNVGTKITMRLPLTLAIVGILLVAENGHEFAFPILNVDEIIHINFEKDVKEMSETLVYDFRGELVTVNYLSDFLGYPKKTSQNKEEFLLILNDGERKIGLVVDQVMGQQNVLLKQLGNLVEVVPFVIGCTILSNSKLVLILNVLELTQSSALDLVGPVLEKIDNRNTITKKRNSRKILIVDDSAIQRRRLSEFLESNGYDVSVAEDGYVALSQSESNDFNAFCVDIQMPLMDGYELITRLRKVEQYSQKPIFVISGLHMDKESEIKNLKELSVSNFHEKPVDLEQLLSELDYSLFGTVVSI